MMEALYKKYLKAYIEKLTIDKEIYYISICDIEYEIIELLHSFEIEGIKIAIVNKSNYSNAVKYRNDTSVSKIVILSPDSVKKIDSLKDFNEYSIFPEVEEEGELFWSIIKSVFCLKKVIHSKIIKFINLIIKEKRITLSQVFELIQYSVESDEINIKKLNENLYLVDCWKSDGELGTNLTSLRKLIRLSDPTEIEKRISIMPTETLEDKELKDFKEIAKLSFSNNYTDLFKKFFFEGLPRNFTIKPVTIKKVRNNDIDENESTKQFKFSYEAYLEESQSITIDIFEDEMKSNIKEQFTNSIAEFEAEINKNNYIQKKFIKIQIENIINDINEGINIESSALEKLIRKIKEFQNVTEETLEYIKVNQVYPHMLNKFCVSTKSFLESYISLLSFIATDENVLEGLGENKIIEDLQNLFISPGESKRIMSFMHPISVFYFNCINDKFQEILSAYEKYDSNSIRILLDGVMNVNTTRFPINIIECNNNLYVINKNYQNMFAYYEFREKTKLSSETSLDIRTITNSMGKYLSEFPYKSEVVMSIIGNPSFKNIASFKKIIDSFLWHKKSIMQRLRIDIISENHKIISREIDDFYRNEGADNKIQFKLLTPKSDKDSKLDSKQILNESINRSDIVLLFDCYVIYKKEELRKIEHNYNSSFNKISTVGCNDNRGEQIINVDFPIEILWSTLHNMFLRGDNSLSKWTINELDNSIVNLIKPKIESNKELMICMITSNLNIIRKIYMKNNFSSNIIRSKGKEFLELTFGSHIKNTRLNDNASEFSCAFSLKSILESILDDGEIHEFVKNMQYEPKEILENLVVEFNYDNENNNVQIIAYYPIDENESFLKEEYKDICEFILNYAFCNSNAHSNLLKSIIVNYLYDSIKNYGDALLVNYIERYFKLNIANDGLNFQEKDYEMPPNIDTTNVRNMISYIETNSIDERFKTDFKYVYDTVELKEMRKQAHMMNILDNKLIKKMDFILKGEQQ